MQLDSVRILGLTRLLSSPKATQLLVTAGADVINAEDTDTVFEQFRSGVAERLEIDEGGQTGDGRRVGALAVSGADGIQFNTTAKSMGVTD
ncbi:hypothetical protein HALLA_01435 (plasmid) [Halostagnicola larsenii XH-48]|uniref:Uncharacterized protein n=1 Tax=Halostagnicola larsenii XH-48 TaxID=797299 RepID=W0JTS9_9EURY|nr:hypothetical protein HALLA_01435 [Halostagnicola larsenii XH-48]